MGFSYRWPVLILFVIFFSGCGGVTQNIKSNLSSEVPVLVTPKRTPLELPDHAKLVITALLQEMRHETNTAAVFNNRGTHDVREFFSYTGFDIDAVDIAKNILVKENSKAAIINIGGFFHFGDESGRRTSAGFEIRYKVFKMSADLPVILESYTSNVVPSYPLVGAFFIPAEIFRKSGNLLPDSFPAYLQFVQEHAIDMSADSGLPAGAISGKQSLIALIFCFDRLPHEALLEVSVDNKKVNPVVMDFNGWRILAIGGKGQLFNPSESFFFIDVYYNKKATASFNRQHIARFSSLKQNLENRWSQALLQVRQQQAQGRIESGMRLLDVRQYGDAVMVQARLKELGYYRLTVDGIFGKGSKAALKKWSRDSLGRESDVFTLEIQEALFKGTGR